MNQIATPIHGFGKPLSNRTGRVGTRPSVSAGALGASKDSRGWRACPQLPVLSGARWYTGHNER